MTPVELQALLYEWQREYDVPGRVLFLGFEELPRSSSSSLFVGGRTWFKLVNGERVSEIRLQEGMAGAPAFLQRSVLWHEACHAEAFNEDGVPNAHDSHFYDLRRRKKAYWLGDMLFKLVGIIWCRRHHFYTLGGR